MYMLISGVFFYNLQEKVDMLDSAKIPREITSRFQFHSVLGRGASGQVYLIKDKVGIQPYFFTFKFFILLLIAKGIFIRI
jgi:hypothetical protein